MSDYTKLTKPAHYNAGDGDFIDFSLAHKVGFTEGNICKYILRKGEKGATPDERMENELIDVLKAEEYMRRLVKHTKAKHKAYFEAKKAKREESLSNPPIY